MTPSDVDLTGDWYGWRLKGRHFVSPHGDRMTPQRLEGLLWRDLMELRLAGYRSRREAELGRRDVKYGPKIKVVVIELAEYRLRGVGVG